MLGIGWGEMLVIAVVVLIVVGPKDLPVMLRNMGRAMGTIRRMSNDFRREIDKAVAADEIREAKKAISDPLKQTSADITREFNSLRDGKVEPSGKLKPTKPGEESVVDAIHAQAGMAPKSRSETMAAAVAARKVQDNAVTPGNADTTTAGEPVKAAKPRAKAAPKNAVTSKAASAKPVATKSKSAAKPRAAKAETAAETKPASVKKPAARKTTARKPAKPKAEPASEPVGGEG